MFYSLKNHFSKVVSCSVLRYHIETQIVTHKLCDIIYVQGGSDLRHFFLRRSSERARYFYTFAPFLHQLLYSSVLNKKLLHLICGCRNGANLIPPYTLPILRPLYPLNISIQIKLLQHRPHNPTQIDHFNTDPAQSIFNTRSIF